MPPFGALLVLVPLAFATLSYFYAEPDRAAYVAQAFNASKGARYCWGGGHPEFGPIRWPVGGVGKFGGIGWDCSGWVSAVIERAPSRPSWYRAPLGTTGLWEALGRPRNDGTAGKPGDLVVWHDGTGRPVHVGFVVARGWAVSAMGRGSSVRGDDPTQCVKLHTFKATGWPVLCTVAW